MAGLISICGDYRLMTKNALWMAHPVVGGMWGRYQDIKDQEYELKHWIKKTKEQFKKHTCLTKQEIENIITNKTKYLNAIQCKKKKIIDGIL
jgi:ATP-dependent protease ClpP protease subunit